MKTCTKCNEIKSLDDFSRVNSNSEFRRSRCKSCCIKHTKAWRKQNPRKTIEHTLKWQKANKIQNKLASQKYLLKKKFNMSLTEYTSKLESQNNVCAICHKTCKSGRNLAVDHNHVTGVNRGLLCANCNIALGHLQEDPNIVNSMLEYIQLYEKNK